MISSRRELHPEAAALAVEAWAEVGDLLDLQLSPLGIRAIEALSPGPGEAIVDIGCGAGQTIMQIAERVGRDGEVFGVDMAPRLLDLARQRAVGLRQARFVAADATVLDLPTASIDGAFSRFGVMGFSDPVAAFTNVRRLLKPLGRLAFVCWRSLWKNELDVLPLQAAGLEHLADPTPFSFEDPRRIERVLVAAGFRRIATEACDWPVSSGGLDAMMTVLLRVGPLGRILREAPELRAAAEPRLREALTSRGTPSGIALTAATWVVTALA